LRGHSSSLYSLAIKAFFFSHTSDGIEVFISVKGNESGRQEREDVKQRVVKQDNNTHRSLRMKYAK
jgi:hypothetical protein